MASEAQAVVVSQQRCSDRLVSTGDVDIDFNSDGQIDYQIDHDRYNLGGNDLDYLQIDKNDVSSPADPYSIGILTAFPCPPGTENDTFESGYVTTGPGLGLSGGPDLWQPIGPLSHFDFSGDG